MTIVLVLLANLSLHGTILAGCLGLVYLMDACRSWETLDARVKRRYQISIAFMVVTFAFVVLILKPTPDVGEFNKAKLEQQQPASIKALQPTSLTKLESAVSGAFLDYWLPSTLFILFVGWWCFRRQRLLIFALPVLSLTGLYALVHGYAHHHGTLFIAAATAFWIAWPNHEEQRSFGRRDRLAFRAMTIVLLGLCALNIWDAEVAIVHEYLYPYSGAEDAARYLKSVGAEKDKILGFLYGEVGIQAYFDHNILVNMPTAYYHHGMPFFGLVLDRDEFARLNPGYVIVFTEQPQMSMEYGIPELRAAGYEIVHFSDGYMIYKRGVYVRQSYFILHRTRP
jgi:hypothetical protein